jgi:hypothetical protein
MRRAADPDFAGRPDFLAVDSRQRKSASVTTPCRIYTLCVRPTWPTVPLRPCSLGVHIPETGPDATPEPAAANRGAVLGILPRRWALVGGGGQLTVPAALAAGLMVGESVGATIAVAIVSALGGDHHRHHRDVPDAPGNMVGSRSDQAPGDREADRQHDRQRARRSDQRHASGRGRRNRPALPPTRPPESGPARGTSSLSSAAGKKSSTNLMPCVGSTRRAHLHHRCLALQDCPAL